MINVGKVFPVPWSILGVFLGVSMFFLGFNVQGFRWRSIHIWVALNITCRGVQHDGISSFFWRDVYGGNSSQTLMLVFGTVPCGSKYLLRRDWEAPKLYPNSKQLLGSIGIQSPSENGNGTQILCWGDDWTPQSFSDNMTGCLGDP